VNTEELEHVENNSTNIVLNLVRELSTTVNQLQAQINSVTNTVNKITQETSTGGNVLRRSGVSQTISSESTRTSPPTFTDSIANISGSEDLLNTCNNNANIQNVVVDPCNLSVSPYMNTFNESNVQTKQTFQPALPLACTVSDEMKAKIWANQYINFGQLLPEEENFDKPTTITVERNMFNKPQLAFQEHSKKIKTLDQWITAFSIYMTIYCQKYQDAVGDLMKYMETVREIARDDGQWLKYVQKFRKSKCQLRVSWANMHQELWLKAMHKTPDLTQEIINGTVQQNVHVGGQNCSNVQRIPNGYCVRYHTNNFCQLPCRYTHKCYVCTKLHSASKCWYGSSGQNNFNMRYPQGNNFRAFRAPSQPRGRFNQSGPRSFQYITRFIRPPIRFPNSIPTFKR
jgi:hypothetical protein